MQADPRDDIHDRRANCRDEGIGEAHIPGVMQFVGVVPAPRLQHGETGIPDATGDGGMTGNRSRQDISNTSRVHQHREVRAVAVPAKHPGVAQQ